MKAAPRENIWENFLTLEHVKPKHGVQRKRIYLPGNISHHDRLPSASQGHRRMATVTFDGPNGLGRDSMP